jgi:hypothetical protein
MERICEHCGAVNPAHARFCRRCGTGGTAPADPSSAPAYRSTTRVTPVMQLWRRLSRQLIRREVRKLLGEPLRVEPPPAGSDVETWHYAYEAAAVPGPRAEGVVCFSVAEGRVITWREPEWGGKPSAER